jgi:hypothetical protein
MKTNLFEQQYFQQKIITHIYFFIKNYLVFIIFNNKNHTKKSNNDLIFKIE